MQIKLRIIRERVYCYIVLLSYVYEVRGTLETIVFLLYLLSATSKPFLLG